MHFSERRHPSTELPAGTVADFCTAAAATAAPTTAAAAAPTTAAAAAAPTKHRAPHAGR